MVSIVVGFIRSAEGRSALDRATQEARLRETELLVVHSMKGGRRHEDREVQAYREAFEQVGEELTAAGVPHRLVEYARGNSPTEDLMQAAADHGGELIVIGIRRRSPVGKLVLGSNAQELLLRSDLPVLAVKAAEED
ncbi:universal stress protein [Nitriliruptoraceae bacterium ZYF776]|nr:universal stress protein [Profundirhabdus halotolerans]